MTICKAIPTEAHEQMAVIAFWADFARLHRLEERLLIHIANERKTSPRQGAYLKAQGVRAGVPDLLLAIPAGGYNGLWLELKRSKGGRVTEAQAEMHKLLKSQGYAVHVCHGAREAVGVIVDYLKNTQKSNHQLTSNLTSN